MALPEGTSSSRGQDRQVVPFRAWLRSKWSRSEGTVIGVAAVLILLMAWELIARAKVVSPLFMVSPVAVGRALIQLLHQHVLVEDIRVSATEFIIGFVLATLLGIPLGLASGWNRRLFYVVNPFLSFLNSTPRVALLPLLILWVGIGLWSKVLLVILGAIFPIAINSMAGVRSVDDSLLQVASAFRARDAFVFRTIILPSSVPFILSGLRLGVGRGILMVVVAEFYASYNGIGHLISQAAQSLDTADSLAGVIVIALIGTAVSFLLERLESRFDKWRPRRAGS